MGIWIFLEKEGPKSIELDTNEDAGNSNDTGNDTARVDCHNDGATGKKVSWGIVSKKTRVDGSFKGKRDAI